MLMAVRIVWICVAVLMAFKSFTDKTSRDSVVTVAVIGIVVAALLISYRMV